MNNRLSAALQENLLTLLCFQTDHAKIIRNCINADLFEGDYYHVAIRAYEYIDRFQVAPGDHISDLFDDILEGKNQNRALIFTDILKYLYSNKAEVNAEYAMSRLAHFIKSQQLKKGIIDAASILQRGDEDALNQAETILNESLRQRQVSFLPGIRLVNTDQSLQFLDSTNDAFPIGIPELDRRGLGPSRKELHLYIGLPKSGKTQWFVSIARHALMHNYKVCHITYEMSETRMCQRYLQNLFSIPKRGGDYTHVQFERDELQRVIGMRDVVVGRPIGLDSPEIRQILKQRIVKHHTRLNNLVIKEFPTGQSTVNELKAYLDLLETVEKFIPDLLIVDYADLLKINSANHRHELGQAYKDLRGLAVERNIAVATASQSNRQGVNARQIDEGNVAEDFSKIATADCVFTYNQTSAERERGLARLYVANGRNDEDKFTVLISQNYGMGQYIFDSALMTTNYWDVLNGGL